MTHRLLRCIGVVAAALLLVAASAVGPASTVGPGAAWAGTVGCPQPQDCLHTPDDMRCHEAESCPIGLWLDEPARTDITVEIVAVDLTTSRNDYVLDARVLTIRAGERYGAVRLSIGADREREDEERLLLRFANPSFGDLETDQVVVTVLDETVR